MSASNLGPTRLVQWTRRLRLCFISCIMDGAPLTSIVKPRNMTTL